MTYHMRVAAAAIALLAASACRSHQVSEPSDPLLEALRGEEREANLTYSESQGKRLFAQYCATCHGDDGHGDGQNASNLNPAPPDLATSRRDPALVRRVIVEGSAAVGRSPLSPPWGRTLSHQEVDYLVAYCEAIARHAK
jgi:mono/diheme cytochrome c family protein